MQEQPLQFKGIINSYRVIVLAVKTSLQFRYQHPQHYDIYQAKFFRETLSSTNPDAARQILICFNNSFKKCLKYIADYHEDEKRVQILDGQVSIWYFTTKARTKKAVLIRFDGKKMLSEQQKKEEKKVQSQVLDVKAQNAFLKETMNKLELQCHFQNKQIQQLRQLVLQKKKSYLKFIKADTRMLSKQTSKNSTVRYLSSVTQLGSSLNFLKSTLKDLIQRVQQQQINTPELEEQEEDMQRLEKYGIRHWVVIDTNNRFIPQNLEIEDNVVRKIGKYKTVQILGRDPMPNKGRRYFSVFLDKISWSIFSVGIANQNRRNYQSSYESPDCISYFGREGTVWSNGLCVGGGPHVPDEVEIIVVVDFLKNLVKWYQQGVEIGSTVLEKQLRQARVVPCLHLSYPDNQVTFNERPQYAKQQ